MWGHKRTRGDLYVSKIVNNTNNNNNSSTNNKNMKNDNNHDDSLNDMSQTSEILRDQAFEEYKKIKQDDV